MMYGRNGESPIAILSPQSPSDCFDIAYEACRLAVRSMSPVAILSDGFLANSSEPWHIPDADEIEPIAVNHPPARTNGEGPFLPYKREPETLARPWAIPGTQGLEHRLGGLAKAPDTGNVSYFPDHNEQMTAERAEKVARLANVIPEQPVFGPEEGDLLVISWGGTFGAVRTAVANAQSAGKSVAHAHIRYINPFPKNFGDLLKKYKKVVVAELNSGQLAFLIRGKYAMDVESFSKIQGQPFKISEVAALIEEALS
jgi:2-oxoglutarate ferredoxin oxidoreductase subunit alpha